MSERKRANIWIAPTNNADTSLITSDRDGPATGRIHDPAFRRQAHGHTHRRLGWHAANFAELCVQHHGDDVVVQRRYLSGRAMGLSESADQSAVRLGSRRQRA